MLVNILNQDFQQTKAHIQTEVNGKLFQAKKCANSFNMNRRATKTWSGNIGKYSESEMLTNESTYCHERKNNQKFWSKILVNVLNWNL